MTKPIPVFYRPEQSSLEAQSFSPSAAKPKQVIADWVGRPDINAHIEVKTFEPVTREQLYAAHDPVYVDGVMEGRLLNGFGNTNLSIARSLPYTSGSLVAATEHVLQNGGVAVSPTSGFHHACHSASGGYCTFNGLMVAALNAYAKEQVGRVLILDFDAHNGNGTEDIIKHLGLIWVKHITAYKTYEDRRECMSIVSQIGKVLDNMEPDLVLFQAGADIHINDPLGGILSTDDMKYRDHKVIGECLLRGIPLVWNLAGGYQRDPAGGIEPVLALHRQTIRETILLAQEVIA